MKQRSYQSGAALLVLGAILAIGVSAFLVSALNSATLNESTTIRTRNAAALQEAKSALIGYVAKEVLDLSNNIPGRLPCPESPSDAGTSNEGRAGSTCDPAFATNKNVGRLPWRTLGLDKLVDASSEPLWYVVSPAWALGGATPIINSGTAGQLTVDGTGDVVAIIIAPGRPLSITPNANQSAAGCQARNQSRNDRAHDPLSANNPNYLDYLECQNASNPIDFSFASSVVENATNEVLNDQVVTITAKDILNAIQGPVAERMQRTVAPLLSEHGDKWITASGGKFLPYAVSFAAPPETNPVTCGAAGTREGVLPTAVTTTAGCISTWQNFNATGTGNSVEFVGCAGSPVTCQFRYYRLSSLGALLDLALNLLGLGSLVGNVGNTGSITATVTALAPNAALAFRDPLATADITVSGGLSHSMTLVPQPAGAASLAIQVPITSGSNDLCTSLVGLVCNLLPGVLASPNTVTVQFPQLADATVQGTQLSATVFPAPYTLNLLTPASGDPHYWFFNNQWHRYMYYAVAPNVSAAQSGGYFTVSDFPAANGSSNDKRFVLAAVGPAVTGQNLRPSTSVAEYLEGENASTGNNTFAYHVFSASGNDRIATCPFVTGAMAICN
jgi:hypothetical protein